MENRGVKDTFLMTSFKILDSTVYKDVSLLCFLIKESRPRWSGDFSTSKEEYLLPQIFYLKYIAKRYSDLKTANDWKDGDSQMERLF